MLYFSKLKIISVIIFTLLLSYFALSNFFSFDDNFFKRNINLGLDLQGGSYLLLEIDNEPVVIQQVQNKLIDIKKYLKNKNVQFKNICNII
jgi:preprotein translocase subunit SecD